MIYLELIARLVAAAYLAFGHAVVSHFVAARLLPGAAPLVRWCATFVVGLALATLGFHALIPFRMFRLPAALALLSLVLAAVLGPAENRAMLRTVAAVDLRALRRLRRALARSRWRGWVYAFAVCAAVVVIRPLVTAPLSWDGLMYHAVKAGLWVQQGGPALVLDPGVPSWDLTRNTLAGGDVFHAWAMLPMSSDLFYGLAQSVEWIALGLAAIALAREIGVREPFASAGAALLVSLAPIRLEVGSGYVEIIEALTVTLAVLFTIRALRYKDAASFVLACAAVGLGCGIKIILVPLCGLILVFLVVGAVRARRWRALALGAVAWAALAAPWPIYNIIDTGTPLSPTPVSVAGIELGRASAAIQHMLDQPIKPYDFDKEWQSLRITFDFPSNTREALGILALVPLVVFLLSVPSLARRRPAAAGLLAALFAGNLAIVDGPNFSTLRALFPEGVSRFLIPAVTLAVPALTAWCAGAARAGRWYYATLLTLALYLQLRFAIMGMAADELNEIFVLLLMAAAIGALAVVARRLAVRPAAVVGVATLFALIGLSEMRDFYRYQTPREAFVLHPSPRGWVDAAEYLDDPDVPQRIAITHGLNARVDAGLFYMLLGRRLQNVLVHVPVSRDGKPLLDPLGHPDKCDYAKWVSRLGAAKVSLIFTLDPATIELAYLEANPRKFTRILGRDRVNGLFKLK